MVYFDKILHAYVFKHFPVTGMQNGDESSLSNILAVRALLVKMLITVEILYIDRSKAVVWV